MTNNTTIENFERQYHEQGGVAKPCEMYQVGASTWEIGEAFGLSSKQVNYYLSNIIGKKYLRYPWRKLLVDSGVTPSIDLSDD